MSVCAAATTTGPAPATYPGSVYGVVVASDIDLHLPAPRDATAPELTLHQAPDDYDPDWRPDEGDLVTRWWDETGAYGYLTARTSSGYRIRFHDVADFDLSADLGRAQYRIAPGRPLDWVAVLATGTFLSLRLLLAGECVLHSGVVEVGGRGLAFVGRSGQGKSTMATLMCGAGARIVTDDVGRVRFAEQRVLVAAGGRESRLRPSASALAERMREAGAVTRQTGDGRSAVSLTPSPAAEVGLDAVVIPLPRRDGGPLEVTSVRPVEAVPLLGGFPRVLGVRDTDMLQRAFAQTVHLVERVPVHVARVPWGEPPDPALAPALLRELGWA